MPTTTILLGLFAVMSGAAMAQPRPDVAEILKKVGATYGAATEYEITSTSTGTAVPGKLMLAFRRPDRYRMEGEDPNMDTPDGRLEPVVLVHDGTALWIYRPTAHEYTSVASADLRGDLKPDSMDDVALARFLGAAALAEGAKFLREEAIAVAGASVDCYVLTASISVPMQRTSVYTWWVEKKSSHVVREDHSGTSVVFTTIELNQRLPGDLFRFVPPPGAHQKGQ